MGRLQRLLVACMCYSSGSRTSLWPHLYFNLERAAKVGDCEGCGGLGDAQGCSCGLKLLVVAWATF